jgi:hypothetical protein
MISGSFVCTIGGEIEQAITFTVTSFRLQAMYTVGPEFN